MKTFISLLILYFTAYSFALCQDLSGKWTGTISQRNSSDGPGEIEITIRQVGSNLTGQIKTFNKYGFIIEKFRGTISGNSIKMNAYEVVKEQASRGFLWAILIFDGSLETPISENKLTIEGTWACTMIYNNTNSRYENYSSSPGGTFIISQTLPVKYQEKSPVLQPISESIAQPKLNEPIVLKNVLFNESLATLLPQSFPELDKLVSLMQSKSTMIIRLEGHTDRIGDADKNLKLSQDRVMTVKRYLIKKGISETRIDTKGYGDTKPICILPEKEKPCQANRRVEFVVTEQ